MSSISLRVVIPHFFSEGGNDESFSYGSGRLGNRLPRSLSLARCIGSVLALNRAKTDWILNVAERHVEKTPISRINAIKSINVEVHIFVSGRYYLNEVLGHYSNRIYLHQLDLKDPQDLPLSAVRCLLDMPNPADFSLYLEDDLIISDSLFIDKMAWFVERTNNKFILMPHRFEVMVANAPHSFYVDGPTKASGDHCPVWSSDEQVFASGCFRGVDEVDFVKALNPHSGCFCVSAVQLNTLKLSSWPPQPFVGPLETAATGAVFWQFLVLKPSWQCREFLRIEHANPSFLSLFADLPQRASLIRED